MARKTEAQKMYNRGFSASMSSPHDLSYWDGKLGHLGSLYLVHWLDGWSNAATGENDYPTDDHECGTEPCRKEGAAS